MKNLGGEETLIFRHAFEQYADTFGVKIIAYRADNGLFSNTSFKEDCLCKQKKNNILWSLCPSSKQDFWMNHP